MTTLNEVKKKLIDEALSHPVQNKYGVELGNGQITTISDSPCFYIENPHAAITAKIDKKYLNGDNVKEEIPIEIIDAPEGFFTGKQVYTFTNPALKDENLKVEILDKPIFGKATVKFNPEQQFAIKSEKITRPLFRSFDGKYYPKEQLPENDDKSVLERYSNEVKSERNARIADTDDYVRLPDITVQSAARTKREPLTTEDRAELETYRQALRDLPTVSGFPFVPWPEFPSALAYELEQKVESRKQRMGAFK